MFIVNQDNNLCVTLEKVSYDIDYDDKTLKKLNDIYDRRMDNVYYHGSTANCLSAIEEEQRNYIRYHGCKKVVRIYVNGKTFAVYEDESLGKTVFEDILYAIKNKALLVTLTKDGLSV